MKQKTLLFIILIAAVTGVIMFKSSTPKPLEAPAIVEGPPTEEPVAPIQRELVPSNPADYGMIVTDPTSGSMSEDDINVMIRNKWKKIKQEFPEETLAKAREVIKEPSQKTQEKMAKIDEELAKCRVILQKDPFNEDAKRKQQNLLVLKAIGRELGPDANQ